MGDRHDPFAVDIFGTSPEVSVATSLKSVRAKPLPDGVSRLWFDEIETVFVDRNLAGKETPAFPEWLEPAVNARFLTSITSFAGLESDSAHFEVVSYLDCPVSESLDRITKSPNVFLRLCGVILTQ